MYVLCYLLRLYYIEFNRIIYKNSRYLIENVAINTHIRYRPVLISVIGVPKSAGSVKNIRVDICHDNNK